MRVKGALWKVLLCLIDLICDYIAVRKLSFTFQRWLHFCPCFNFVLSPSVKLVDYHNTKAKAVEHLFKTRLKSRPVNVLLVWSILSKTWWSLNWNAKPNCWLHSSNSNKAFFHLRLEVKAKETVSQSDWRQWQSWPRWVIFSNMFCTYELDLS